MKTNFKIENGMCAMEWSIVCCLRSETVCRGHCALGTRNILHYFAPEQIVKYILLWCSNYVRLAGWLAGWFVG